MAEIKADYEECIEKVNQLTEHIKLLANENQLENLEDVIVPE